MPTGIYQHKLNQGFQKGNHPKTEFKKGNKIGYRFQKGQKFTEIHKINLSDALKGNTNIKGKHWKMSKQGKENIKKSRIGMKFSEKHKENLRKAKMGERNNNWNKKPSIKTRKKLSKSHKGEKGSNWKGGITSKNKEIRNSIEFRLWREAIFIKDNWICQRCKISGGHLHPHHIFNFASYFDLRFDISNGITLCKKCHDEFHKKYGYKNNTKEQIIEFLNYASNK